MASRPGTLAIFVLVAAATASAAAWLAPAALVDSRLVALTDGAVRLAAAKGTVWHAQAELVAGVARLPLAWRIDPWPLLRGEVRLHVTPITEAGNRGPHADIAISGAGVAMRDVAVTIPASALTGALVPAAASRIGGDVAVTTTAFEWAPPANRGGLRVQWQRARVALAAGARPLDVGDVVAELAADGDRLSGPVSNVGGDVAINGTIAIRANDAVSLSAVLSPRGPIDAATAQALALLGPTDGRGWRVEWRAPLR